MAAACWGAYAAMALTDGTNSYATPPVRVTNLTGGKTGLWLYQIGDRQEYDTFELFQAQVDPPPSDVPPAALLVWSGEYQAPNVPSPQDWVLVIERAER